MTAKTPCSDFANDTNKPANKAESYHENNDSTFQTVIVPQNIEDTILKHDKVYSDNLAVSEMKMEVEVTQDLIQIESSKQSGTFTYPSLVFENIKMLTGAWSEFYPKKGQIGELPVFLKGCKW